ncbi:MAG: ABC transporter permease [Pseudomonadota bacterium]
MPSSDHSLEQRPSSWLARSPLLLLTLARLRLSYREPSTIFWAFCFPVLLTMGLGVAFRVRPPDPVAAAVEAGPGAEALRDALAASPGIVVDLLEHDEARQALRSGRVALVVVPDSPRRYVFDPTRPESRLARAVIDDALQRSDGRADVTPTIDAHITQPGGRYVDFLIPGLLGLNIMSSAMWGIGWGIVETRTRKLLKRLAATPMQRSHFLLSFILVRLLFLAIELLALSLFGYLVFSVSVQGSLLLLVGMAYLGALAFTGIGLLVASRAKNTHTVSGLVNVVMMPMFVCSGVFFSSARFPELMQPLIRLLPLTALIDSMRAVMNEGAGALDVAPQALLLALFGAVSFLITLKIFRWS